MCAPDLLYSERRADFLSSEDYGALSQDFRQLEDVQAQQLAGVGDHWKADKRCLTPPHHSYFSKFFFSAHELTLLCHDLCASCRHELDVSQLQDSRQQLKHVSDLLFAELQHLQRLLRKERGRERDKRLAAEVAVVWHYLKVKVLS